jgi:uncharacterized protein
MVEVRMADRLADVPGPDWDSLVGDDGFYLSHDWLRYVEPEHHERSRYLLARQGDRLTGGLVLSWLDDPATIRYRPGHFADLLGIEGRTLLAGASRGYRTTLLLERPFSAEGRAQTLAALLRTALAVARDDGCAGIVLPFLTTGALTEMAGVARLRAALDLPEAEISGCGQGLDAYAGRQARGARQKIAADRRRFAAAGWTVRLRSMDECWREAALLLYQLQRKHGHDEMTLAGYERWMEGQARELDDRSVMFCCEDDDGIAGFAGFFCWRSVFYGRMAGFDYDRLRGGNEYFTTVIYEPIEYASRHGMTVVHLGVGSWQAKGYRGAVMRPLWSAFIPADGADDGPGLDLVNGATVAQWTADITARSVPMDEEEWQAPLRLAP